MSHSVSGMSHIISIGHHVLYHCIDWCRRRLVPMRLTVTSAIALLCSLRRRWVASCISSPVIHENMWPFSCIIIQVKKVKVAHTRLQSVGFRSWSRFLAVSLQVMWVVNPAVDCHYFLPGLQLPPTSFAAWWTEAQWVWTVCLKLLPESIAATIWTQAFCVWQRRAENDDKNQSRLDFCGLLRHFAATHRVNWRHRIYGHDTVAILWV